MHGLTLQLIRSCRRTAGLFRKAAEGPVPQCTEETLAARYFFGFLELVDRKRFLAPSMS